MATVPLYDEDNDYINEDHISEFAKALTFQDDSDFDLTNTQPTTPSSELNDHDNYNESCDEEEALQSSGTEEIDDSNTVVPTEPDNPVKNESIQLGITPTSIKPDLITSKSDWFPIINDKPASGIKKRKRSKSTFETLQNEFRNSASYFLLRWPILVCVFIWIAILGSIYFIIRVYVALSEYFFTWTGERKRLRDKLRNSRNYDEWIENAVALDKFLNLDKWSVNAKFSYYDYKTVKLTINRLKKLRNENNLIDLMMVLQGCLKKNFAGIENRQLYSHRYYGTKNLVEEYYKEVVFCIEKITDSTSINPETKRKFFKIVSKNFGKSALCLSGGACFAYTHFGIAKALLDQDLLPNIISGTSGGGLIAALLCTRTNEELKKLLVPQLARKITACEDPWYVWIPRLIKTGARFDSVAWARKSNFFTRGSTTFEEAVERTGRKLNISTVPADPHSPVILCNDITSPHCIIWSTLLASSAVPGILNPVVLMMKNPSNNAVIPFSLGSKWRDGSLRTDIPVDALNTYYNVNFTIVSQVNPHISLFFFAPKGTVGRPVPISRRKTTKEKFASLRGGFVATALEQLTRLEIQKWLKIIKSLDLLPRLLKQDWSNIWLQNFTGTITIWPRNRLKDFWYILSDPNESQLEEMLLKGERCMYPRLLFIKHRASIERAIERGRKSTYTQMFYENINLYPKDSDDEDEFDPSDYDFNNFKKSIGMDLDKEVENDLDSEDDSMNESDLDLDDDPKKVRRNTIF